MSGVIRKKCIDRRAFLKGSGVSLALPWLDAMVPALPTGDAGWVPPLRVAYIYAPNGMVMSDWRPKQKGTFFRLPPTLASLKGVRKDLNVLSGLTLDGARPHGDGPGDHARSVAAFLTSGHPFKTGGADIRVGVSVDQVIASKIGQSTAFPSLELGMEAGRRAGACDSGYSCAYSNNIAWRSPNVPVPKAVNPRQVFERLFGDPGQVDDEMLKLRRGRTRRSILDAVLEDARSLTRRLGGADRDKVDGYLTAIRELERRMEIAERNSPVADLPEGLKGGARGGYQDRLDVMYDIIVLAFRADLTRTVTFMLGNAGSNRSYRFLDVPEGHHHLSHHGGKKDKVEKLRRINRFHVEHFARFLSAMGDVREGNQSLLQSSMVMYGSGISDGNRHNHEDLPILLAGRLGGKLRTGRHLVYPRNTPLANLHVETLGRLGIRDQSFGDSNGRLKGL